MWIYDRRGANACEGSKIAPLNKYDASGHVVASIGTGMTNFPHGLFVDRDSSSAVMMAKSLQWPMIYLAHLITRNSFGLMTRKLSVTESQRSAQFRGTFSRRKLSVASANWAHVA
jgi:hypothetical protein